MKISHDMVLYIVGIVAVIGVITSSYFYIQQRDQAIEIENLLHDRNAILQDKNGQLAVASSTISKLNGDLENIREELEELADDYRDEKDRNEEFEDQIRGLAGTLGDLDKLAKTDEELLQKYSKVYFLNENYIPERLKKINDKYVLDGKGDQYFHAKAIDSLEDMFAAAKRDDIDLKVVSAYRSFDEQTKLKGQYTQVYGSGANTFSADQGYSEHQLGTTLDLTVADVGGTYTSFGETEAYTWLQKNAHKYGFILSYPEDNGFYVYEPWHWRYVGEDLARDLIKDDSNFYDWDQREIDQYLLNIFD